MSCPLASPRIVIPQSPEEAISSEGSCSSTKTDCRCYCCCAAGDAPPRGGVLISPSIHHFPPTPIPVGTSTPSPSPLRQRQPLNAWASFPALAAADTRVSSAKFLFENVAASHRPPRSRANPNYALRLAGRRVRMAPRPVQVSVTHHRQHHSRRTSRSSALGGTMACRPLPASSFILSKQTAVTMDPRWEWQGKTAKRAREYRRAS